MNFLEQLKKLLEDAKEDKDVQQHLAELRKPTTEGLVAFLETDEGRKVLNPMIDRGVTKGIETFKTNNLEKIVEERFNKLHPPETPEAKRMRELEENLSTEKNERIRTNIKNKLITEATTKKLPLDLMDILVGADEDASLKNLSAYEQVFTTHLQKMVEEKFAAGGRQPEGHGGGKPPKTFTREQMKDVKFVNDNWVDVQAAMNAGTIVDK